MLSLGMPTLIETPAPEECAALCRSLSLDFIEFNMNLPQYQLPALNADLLLSAAERYGLYYTIHLDENLNTADFNPLVAEAYRQTVYETIALARTIRAPVLNMHLPRGVYFTLPDRRVYLFGEYESVYLAAMRSFRDECTRRIGCDDVRICIENTDGFLPFQEKAVQTLLESPVFGLTLDVGHSHAASCADEALYARHSAALTHIHLHDARGSSNHLPLGTGEADIERYLAMARANHCRVVLETKTVDGLRQSVEWLKRQTL